MYDGKPQQNSSKERLYLLVGNQAGIPGEDLATRDCSEQQGSQTYVQAECVLQVLRRE